MVVEAGLQEENVSRQRSGEMLLEEGPQAGFSRSQQTSLSAEQSGSGGRKDGGRGVMAMGKGRMVPSGVTYDVTQRNGGYSKKWPDLLKEGCKDQGRSRFEETHVV